MTVSNNPAREMLENHGFISEFCTHSTAHVPFVTGVVKHTKKKCMK